MARIFKRGKYWWVDYRLPDGRRIRRSTGFTDKKMAELMLKDIELQIARKTLKIPVGITIQEFWERYSDYAKAHKTEQTWKTEKSVFPAFMNFLHSKGIKRLDKLHPEILEKYKVLLLEQGNSRFTINKKLRTIKAIISKAVEWELLPENPFKKVKLLKQPEGRLRFLTKEEIKKLVGDYCETATSCQYLLLADDKKLLVVYFYEKGIPNALYTENESIIKPYIFFFDNEWKECKSKKA